jgi:hypothetical protein
MHCLSASTRANTVSLPTLLPNHQAVEHKLLVGELLVIAEEVWLLVL